MAAFLRIVFVIPIAVMAAIGVAVCVYLAAFGFTRADIWGGPDNLFPVIVYPVAILLRDIGRFAGLPFLAAIVLSEMLAVRSMIAWTLFGGAIGAAIQLAAGGAMGAATLLTAPMLPPLAAGLSAGFTYWLIAGHKAGRVAGPNAAGVIAARSGRNRYLP